MTAVSVMLIAIGNMVIQLTENLEPKAPGTEPAEQEQAEELLNLLSETPEEKFEESADSQSNEPADISIKPKVASEKKSAAIKEENIEKSKEWDSFVTSVFEIEGMEEEYYYGGESHEGEMSNSLDFERLKKLVSLLELSMREKDVLNIGR